MTNIINNLVRTGTKGNFLYKHLLRRQPITLGPIQQFHSSVRMMSNLQQQFDEAKERLGKLKEDPGNVAKLKLYGLFKQATMGECNTPKPGMFDMVGKAKWDAWSSLGKISKEEAQKEYIGFVDKLVQDSAPQEQKTSATGDASFETITFTRENKVNIITLNRPTRKNAINLKMYEEIIKCLQDSAADDSVLTVITGAGEFYSSGNDLGNFTTTLQSCNGDLEAAAKLGADISRNFVANFIDFPKPLVALVNGPAVGISVTVLGLFDIVYASDKATFHTPFSSLGISPEGCSTYVFPKLMGSAKANEVIMLNRKLTAVEACERGLVTEVFPNHLFRQETQKRIEGMGKLPKTSLRYAKSANRDIEKETLHKVNAIETDNLLTCFKSEECANAIAEFLTRKSNL